MHGRSLIALLFIQLATLTPLSAGLSISGRIALPDGAPAVDVQVDLVPQPTAYEKGLLSLEGSARPEKVEVGRTDATGRFELQAPAAGMWTLHVAAARFRPMEYALTPLLDDTVVPPLELARQAPLRVRVLDPDGRPLAGALIAVDRAAHSASRLWRSERSWDPARRLAITRRNGVARLGRDPKEPAAVRAWAPGYAEGSESGVTARAIALQLQSAHPGTIAIQDEVGLPVARALVLLGESYRPIGLTDDTGILGLPLSSPGPAAIHVLAADGRFARELLVAAERPPAEPPVVTVKPLSSLSGRVVDEQTREPLRGALVWPLGDPGRAVTTDSGGGYVLPSTSGRETWLGAAAAGYITGSQPLLEGSGSTLSLAPAARVRGVIVDREGTPIETAEVTAEEDLTVRRGLRAMGSARESLRALTDLDGRFELAPLRADAGYVLRARKDGFAPGRLEILDPRSSAASGVRIVLREGRALTGSVAGSGGEPVPGALLELEERLLTSSPARAYRSALRESRERILGETDPEGRFSVEHLPAGTFDLTVSAPGYAPAWLPALEISEEVGANDLGEILLEPGVAIEGRATDASGVGLAGVRIYALRRGVVQRAYMLMAAREGTPDAISDPDGFFALADRSQGERVDLYAHLAGYADASLPGVEAPTASPVTLRLERTSRVIGEVVDERGRPIADAVVGLRIEAGSRSMSFARESHSATTGSNGAFVLEEVPPGSLELTVQAKGYRQARLTSLEAQPGRDLTGVRVELEPGAVIRGRVTGPDGVAVSGVQLMAGGSRPYLGGALPSFARSDGGGEYRLEGVAPGPLTVTARHPDFPEAQESIDVRLGDNTLDFTLESGARVSGRVVDAGGEPVLGAQLVLLPPSRMTQRAWEGFSDAAGSFSIGGVPEGTFTLRAHKDGLAPSSIAGLEVGPGGLSDLEIRLSAGGSIAGRLIGLEPAETAEIQIYAGGQAGSGNGHVLADGGYRIEDLAPGEYRVQGWIEATGQSANGRATVAEGGAETPLDLEFRRGLTLTGLVLRQGEPRPGTSVEASGIDVSSYATSTTDDAGRFELRGLEPGRHRLRVGGSRAAPSHSEELALSGDRDVVVEIVAANLAGRVLDGTQLEPLDGAAVRLEPLGGEGRAAARPYALPLLTDSEGFFRFPDVPEGGYRLVASKEGYAPGERSVIVGEGLDQEGLEVRLSPTEGILVRVLLPDGTPAPEFSALILGPDGRQLLLGSYGPGPDGMTRLSVPPGSWELLAATPTSAVASAPLVVPGEVVVVRLGEQAILEVRVPELEGAPHLGWVTVAHPDGRPFRHLQLLWTRSEWSLRDGRATVGGLSPGRWSVRVEAPGGRIWEGWTELVAGRNPALVLR